MTKKNFIIGGAAILIAVVIVLSILLWQDFTSFINEPLAIDSEHIVLTVVSGDTIRTIADRLHEAGSLESPRYLALLARLNKQARDIKVGEYLVEQGTSAQGLLDLLVAGSVMQHTLTVIEGWTFKQMLGELATHDAIQHTLSELTDEQIMTRIGYPGVHPEGRFAPDTYHFPKGTTDIDFLKRAYQTQADRVMAAWANRAKGLPLKTPYEALILASIIEKETGNPKERARIAGVFTRRLLKGIRLQTDPTVIYGLGEQFDGNLRRRDLETDTPYNTYTRSGLPPTPIALPGGDALLAALHPMDGTSLYFVSRGNGSHYFSDTLAEHNRAVMTYQLGTTKTKNKK